MSKSLGNSLLLADLLKEYHPEVIKFALLQTNYRGDINVTDALFPEAEKHMLSFHRVLAEAKKAGVPCDGTDEGIDSAFDEAMDDDFNTAKALADLFGIFKTASRMLREKDFDGANAVLGQVKKDLLSSSGSSARTRRLSSPRVEAKHAASVPARHRGSRGKESCGRKPRATGLPQNALREEITAKGWSVRDTKDGAVVEKI